MTTVLALLLGLFIGIRLRRWLDMRIMRRQLLDEYQTLVIEAPPWCDPDKDTVRIVALTNRQLMTGKAN